MHGACKGKKSWPRPLGPWEVVLRPNIIKLQITNLISKIFIPNFVCVLTNKRYKTYQTGFYPSSELCPRGGTWGYLGVKNLIPPV